MLKRLPDALCTASATSLEYEVHTPNMTYLHADRQLEVRECYSAHGCLFVSGLGLPVYVLCTAVNWRSPYYDVREVVEQCL